MENDTHVLFTGQSLPGRGEIKHFTPQGGDVTKFAAQYVRMSTEHQKYSTENQSAAIAEYAGLHGLTIVRSYADKGRSGLNLEGRPALRQLLADIHLAAAPFRFILVFDVSRWGRFQDIDESAYYEFMCRRAGFEIRYCAEPFENDGSMFSNLVKSIKRLMAAEYSRELSAKVFAAKCRLIGLGFRQGGAAGYGLRRLVVDQNRNPKFELRAGERKAIHTDRIILVPGPSDEVQVVRDIFELFVSRHKSIEQIVRHLNRKGLLNEMGRPWHRRTVKQILTNEKYIGNNVFNRQTRKLKAVTSQNDKDLWVRADGSFMPIINKSVFNAACKIMAVKTKRLSDDEALARLQSCLKRHGRLSKEIIIADKETPCATTYENKFGSLRRAFELIGYSIPERCTGSPEILRKRSSTRRMLLEAAIAAVERAGGEVRLKPGGFAFVVDDCVTISVRLVCNRRTVKDPFGWDLRVGNAYADLIVAARIETETSTVLDYYLFPGSVVTKKYCRLASRKRTYWNEYRYMSLDTLPNLIREMKSEITTA